MTIAIQDIASSIATEWQAAWNSHDMGRMARLLAEDVAWITVGGRFLEGRTETEAVHAALHAGPLGPTRWSNRDISASLLAPDLAVVHLWWQIDGEQDESGTARPARQGVFTWVLENGDGDWRIRAAQGTNVSS